MSPFNNDPVKRALWLLSSRDRNRVPFLERERIHLIDKYYVYRSLTPTERLIVTWQAGKQSMKRNDVVQWIKDTRGKRPPYAGTSMLLTIREVSELYDLSPSAIRSFISSNPHTIATRFEKIGRQWYVDPLDAYELFKGYALRDNGRSKA